MNRRARIVVEKIICIPHARGDEPKVWEPGLPGPRVFPTHVGMNRAATRGCSPAPGIPHARGDEP